MNRRGSFITLEGGEGAGKSTQAGRLAGWLRQRGLEVLVTREPGGSSSAEVLREILLQGRVAPFGARAEALFFAVARREHVIHTIRPALQDGIWVVCDRFLDSTWAYQGTAGVAAEYLSELDHIAVDRTRPDLTLILDIPAEFGLARLRSREGGLDRFEADALSLHEARRRAFLAIAAQEPSRCVVIDAERDESDVAAAVQDAVRQRLDIPEDGRGAMTGIN